MKSEQRLAVEDGVSDTERGGGISGRGKQLKGPLSA